MSLRFSFSQSLSNKSQGENWIGDPQNKQMAVLGLAFKPNTDDMRQAVSIKIITRLLNKGAEVYAYDPAAVKNAKNIFKERINYTSSMHQRMQEADCCIIVTEWDELEQLEPEDLIKHMRTPALVDGRRITDPDFFRNKVKYAAIGLGPMSRVPDPELGEVLLDSRGEGSSQRHSI